MQQKNLILLIAVGLIFLGLGYVFGLSSAQKGIEQSQVGTSLSDLLASKIIGQLSTVASGDITEISGRNITLSNEGDILTISIKEDATIARLAPPTETTEAPQPAARKEIEFAEIKVGDWVNIASQLKADGTLEGIDVMISP